MISDKVLVSDKENTCDGLDAALETITKTAEFEGFNAQQVETLRTLADEMITGAASMLKVFSGTMWAETEDDTFKIMLEMEGLFTQEERESLIELTRDDKNTLPEGFFAKLGVLLGDALTGEYFYPYGMTADQSTAEMMWTSEEIATMMADMDRHDPEDKELHEEAKKTLDMLADDIQVMASSNKVLITVTKALPKQG